MKCKNFFKVQNTVLNQLSANQLSANSVNRKNFSVSTIFEFQVEHQIFLTTISINQLDACSKRTNKNTNKVYYIRMVPILQIPIL